MERLTNAKEAAAQRRAYEKRLEQGYPRSIPEERFLKLAAYEDTGLEPGEIGKIREDIESGYLKSMARRYAIDLDRLRELAKADREGRCVVLPCEVGSTVYMLFCGEVVEKRIGQFHVNGYTSPKIWADIDCDWSTTQRVRWDLAFGKTVFLTREEAEAALKEAEE